MKTFRSVGRIVGVLFLVQTALAPLTNFWLFVPALNAPPGFLVNAAANSGQVYVGVLLLTVTGALWIAIAVTALPVLRQYSHSLALWFLALAIVSFCGLLVEGFAVRTMLALSQEYSRTAGADAALFAAPAALARSLRSAAHYTNLLLSGASLLLLYGALYRHALIPRVLSVLGLVAVVALLVGALIPLLGQPTVMQLFMPMGLAQLALVLWLIVKGFQERSTHPFRADAAEATLP
jgi:hypothetical protein